VIARIGEKEFRNPTFEKEWFGGLGLNPYFASPI
jgi:hypothetical protein